MGVMHLSCRLQLHADKSSVNLWFLYTQRIAFICSEKSESASHSILQDLPITKSFVYSFLSVLKSRISCIGFWMIRLLNKKIVNKNDFFIKENGAGHRQGLIPCFITIDICIIRHPNPGNQYITICVVKRLRCVKIKSIIKCLIINQLPIADFIISAIIYIMKFIALLF